MRNDIGMDLRSLIEGIEEHCLVLETLGLPVEQFDISFFCQRLIRFRNNEARKHSLRRD